jgi:hypothetical protein
MRTLNLKGMSWIMALAMMFIVSFTSCSDDKEEGATTPVFPEEQAISCNAGETKVLTFDANMTWQLSSTAAIWCKFEVNGEDKEVVKGEAGKQSITIKVTDAAQEIGKTSEAQLKLDMGGETKVIATVTRSAKGYSLKIYDAEGNEITTEQGLEVGYKKQISFTVKANFRFAATSFPEWVILDGGSMAGEVNDKEEGELKIQATNGLTVKENGEYEKWPVEAGKDSKNVITFADEAGNASFSFPVFFKGMGAEDINITEPVISSRYGWNVSLDGKTFKLAGSMDGGENVTTFNDKMEFTVVSLKDEYEVVLLDASNDQRTGRKVIKEMSSSWIKYIKNGNKVTLTVDKLSPDMEEYDSREGYALVIPKAQYEQIKEDIVANLVTTNEEGDQDLVYVYGQNNLLINLIQEEEKADGESFEILKGGYMPLTCNKVTDESILNKFHDYSVTAVYSVEVPKTENYNNVSINPLLSNWSNINGYSIYNTKNDSENTEIVSEPGENSISIDVPEEPIYIVFKDKNSVNKKILMVQFAAAVFTVTDNMLNNINCTLHSNNGGWVSDLYSVDGNNIWEVTPTSPQLYMIKFASSENTIKKLQCYNFDAEELTETTSDFNFNDTEASDVSIDSGTIYVYYGQGTYINYSIALLITTNTDEKYLLVVNQPQ